MALRYTALLLPTTYAVSHVTQYLRRKTERITFLKRVESVRTRIKAEEYCWAMTNRPVSGSSVLRLGF